VNGVPHFVLERNRVAERWRTARWDSLVTNGPAWHDRFPGLTFSDVDKSVGPDDFPLKDTVADYLVAYAKKIAAPVRCGVEVLKVERKAGQCGFRIETSTCVIEAHRVVAATGSFQRPIVPAMVPAETGVLQMHSTAYRNPAQLPDGAVLVVGSGSSGTQIAEELLEAGRKVFLSVGPHERPPRAYRGRDYCWWLGVLGKWDAAAQEAGKEHVTIAVSGAHGGHTIDFRLLATKGITLVGRTEACSSGVMRFAPDLVENLRKGDANFLSVLDEADAYVARKGLELPEEPEARRTVPDADCVRNPILSLDLAGAGVARLSGRPVSRPTTAGSRSTPSTRRAGPGISAASRQSQGFIFWGCPGNRDGHPVSSGACGTTPSISRTRSRSSVTISCITKRHPADDEALLPGVRKLPACENLEYDARPQWLLSLTNVTVAQMAHKRIRSSTPSTHIDRTDNDLPRRGDARVAGRRSRAVRPKSRRRQHRQS
jgi:putative flavoprotein involved in K+ transport